MAARPKNTDEAGRNKSEQPRVRARTPVQLARQEAVFNMSVIGLMSYREIRAAFAEKGETIALETIVSDIRYEEQLRADELGARRETEKARSVAFYESIAKEGMRLAAKSDGQFMQPLARGLDSATKARERIDKILGLDAPTKVELGLSSLLDALDVPTDEA